MNRYGPSFVLSVLLHVGLLALALISWKMAPKPIPVASVPVELVSQVPMHAQTETPVDKLAVKTPTPEPAPEEETKPTPPTPAPKLPVPVPQKEVVAPPVKTPAPKPVPVKAPDPKPTPAPPKPAPTPTPAPPDKNGMKKPVPTPTKQPVKPAPTPAKATPAKPTAPAKPVLDLDALSQIAAAPSKSRTRTPAQANTHATNGNSNYGAAPADAGVQTALTALTNKLKQKWNPNCDVPGANLVSPEIRFTISPAGRVVSGPEWTNKRSDPLWSAAASRALSAVKQGELYDDLPKELYNRPITIVFDGRSACGG